MGSLGEMFQQALANEATEPRTPLAQPAALDGGWPYTVAAMASGVAGLGAVGVLSAMFSFSRTQAAVGLLLLALGGLTLMAMWLRLLRTAHGGMFAAIGAAALPATAAIGTFAAQSSAILFGGFGMFTLGTLLARGVHDGVRLAAVMALGFTALAVWATTIGSAVPPNMRVMCVEAWVGSIAAMCFSLALNLRAISRRNRRL